MSPRPEQPAHDRRSAHDFVELWINLARREWSTLVILPAGADGSTAEEANALADIGKKLSYGPVSAITVNSLEFGSAMALADLQQHVRRERQVEGLRVTAAGAPGGLPEADPGDGTAAAPPSVASATEPMEPSGDIPVQVEPPVEALAVVPPTRLIISIPPVVTEPLALAAAQEADAVVLAIRMNQTRLDDLKRTIQLVGQERITGCLLIR